MLSSNTCRLFWITPLNCSKVSLSLWRLPLVLQRLTSATPEVDKGIVSLHRNPGGQFPVLLPCPALTSCGNYDLMRQKSTRLSAWKLFKRFNTSAIFISCFVTCQYHTFWRHDLVVCSSYINLGVRPAPHSLFRLSPLRISARSSVLESFSPRPAWSSWPTHKMAVVKGLYTLCQRVGVPRNVKLLASPFLNTTNKGLGCGSSFTVSWPFTFDIFFEDNNFG